MQCKKVNLYSERRKCNVTSRATSKLIKNSRKRVKTERKQVIRRTESGRLLNIFKVTICPEFFGTVSNFEGLTRKNTRSFETLNCPEFRTLSRICPELTSRHVKRQAVDQNAVDHFDVFACQRCILLSSKRTKSIFGRGSATDPAGGAYDAPSDLLVGWRGRCQLRIPLPLDAFGVSISAS